MPIATSSSDIELDDFAGEWLARSAKLSAYERLKSIIRGWALGNRSTSRHWFPFSSGVSANSIPLPATLVIAAPEDIWLWESRCSRLVSPGRLIITSLRTEDELKRQTIQMLCESDIVVVSSRLLSTFTYTALLTRFSGHRQSFGSAEGPEAVITSAQSQGQRLRDQGAQAVWSVIVDGDKKRHLNGPHSNRRTSRQRMRDVYITVLPGDLPSGYAHYDTIPGSSSNYTTPKNATGVNVGAGREAVGSLVLHSATEKQNSGNNITPNARPSTFVGPRSRGSRKMFPTTIQGNDQISSSTSANGVRSPDLASHPDPWNLQSSKVKGSWTEMQCPFIELFCWKRIVVDHFSAFDQSLNARLAVLRGGSRWVLENEELLRTLSSAQYLAAFLFACLGAEDPLGQPNTPDWGLTTSSHDTQSFLNTYARST